MIIVILLSILAWAPLLYPGFIQTHSGLGAVYDALSARSPSSGWLPTYGTPGDGPLASWLLVILKTVVGPLAALKLLYAGSFILAGLGMYLLAKRIWGQWPGLVAAAVYMLIPYRLVAIYVRGALAESLLLALAPFLFVALHKAARLPQRRALLAAALLAMLLSLLNFGLAVLVIALALVWSVTNLQTPESSEPSGVSGVAHLEAQPDAHAAPSGMPDVPKLAVLSVLSVVAGAILGLLVLLPAGGSLLATMPGWSDHLVYFFQLFSPAWGFGESVAGWQDAMSFQIGLVPVALAIAALWGAYEAKVAVQRRAVLVLSILACALVFLTLTLAAPLWQVVPLAALVAYPWQLLGLAALPLAMLAAVAAHALMPQDQPAALVMLAVLVAATVLGSYTYLAPRYIDAADLPDLSHPPLARLGDDILLLDAQVENQAHPGGSVKLSLVWQALRQPAADYTIFTHLLDGQGNQGGQIDVRPQNDQKPTNTWLRGEVVHDEITIPVDPGAPPGEYHLSVGMYLLATMQRLPIAGAQQGEVVLGPIKVQW
jgi:hypothetical protein